MKTLTFKTNINCGHCVSDVKPLLDSEPRIEHWEVNTENPDKLLTINTNSIEADDIIGLISGKGYEAALTLPTESTTSIIPEFWSSADHWKRAARNTFNCLIGCSIGDFGTIIFFQTFYPQTNIFLVMGLAMAMGLLTSIIFESIILKIKEGFAWTMAVKTAVGMSFLSMLAMEFAENATDYFLTGGKVPPSEPFFWVALGIALIAGFLVPFPYNYYKLRKYNKACH